MMNSQEIETALRERIPIVVLIWVDDEYGLIRWKIESSSSDTAPTRRSTTPTSSPTPSFGARGYRIEMPDELLPTLCQALADDTVSVIACPVDYSANLQLTDALGELDESLS
jgi:acetolactate synthase-1/2/3 large subunit